MSFVVVIVILIVVILFLLVFSFGFFLGLSRKKKDIKELEKEHELQKKTQESIVSFFMQNKEISEVQQESNILSVRIINRGYKRIKKYLKFKYWFNALKEEETVNYLRKYFFSYLGIAIFILGIGLFVKNTINSAYINIAGRFVITVIVSLIFIFIGSGLTKKYKTFSSILIGGAVGILYVSFTISYYSYGIFSDFTVLAVYMGLTLFSVFLSLIYNRFELLFLAVTAGFVAPLFSGIYTENSSFLLVYLMILDIGAVFISLKFKNFLLRLVPALFSGIYLLLIIRYAYQHSFYDNLINDFLLLNIIYFILIILSVVYHLKHDVEYRLYELMMIVVINLIYYSIGFYMLNVINSDYKGIFTVLTAVFNMIFFIAVLIIKKSVKEELVHFFGIVSLLFLTLIPPVELVGKSITMIWAVETVLLMWVSVRLDIKMLRFISSLLMLGLIVSFTLDVTDNFFAVSFNAPHKRLLINKSFVSGLMTSIGLGLNVIISGKSKDVYLIKPIKMSWFRFFISVISVLALYVSIYTEILYRLTISIRNDNLINMYLGLYNFSFILFLLIIISFIKNKQLKYFSGILALLSLLMFFGYYLYEIIIVRDHLLSDPSVSVNKFNDHIYLISVLLFIFYFTFLNVRTINERYKKTAKWILSISIIAVLSTEIDHWSIIKSFGSGIPVDVVLSEVHRFQYSLFWIISSFVIAISAFIFKDIDLIRIAMVTLLLIILKSFIFDLKELSALQQTVSYTVLGFVIIFTAFVRQRLFEKLT